MVFAQEPKRIDGIVTTLDILPIVSWRSVKRAIKYFYPTDKNDYLPVFNDLKARKTKKPRYNDEVLEITAINFTGDGEFEDRDCRYYTIHTNKYSLSFRPWGEVVNIPISPDTLKHYLLEDIVAHVLWELTYFGMEEEMKAEAKKLAAKVRKIRLFIANKEKI